MAYPQLCKRFLASHGLDSVLGAADGSHINSVSKECQDTLDHFPTTSNSAGLEVGGQMSRETQHFKGEHDLFRGPVFHTGTI